MMKIFVIVVLLAACEGQSTTKHKSMSRGSSCFTDQSVHEEVKILRELLLITNSKLQAMQKAHQSQQDDINVRLEVYDETFTTVDEKFTTVNRKLQGHDEKFTTVDRKLHGHDEKFTTVDRKLQGHDEKFTTVDRKLQGHDEKFTTVDRKLQGHDGKFTTVDSKLEDMDADLGEMKSNLGQMTEEKQARKESAFFARDVPSGYGDDAYKSGDRLVYRDILMNPGGHYSKTTGEYSCKKSGVYYFTYTVYGYQIEDGYSHSQAAASLIKDGTEQSEVWVTNDNTENIDITLSQSLVLQCNAGQKVWLESPYGNNYIYGYSDNNMFAGVLLFMN